MNPEQGFMRMSFSGGSRKPRANGEVAWRAEIAPAKAHGRWLRVNPSESARDDVSYPNIIPTRGQGAGVVVPLYQPVIVHSSSHLHKFPGTTCSVQEPTEQILTAWGQPFGKSMQVLAFRGVKAHPELCAWNGIQKVQDKVSATSARGSFTLC